MNEIKLGGRSKSAITSKIRQLKKLMCAIPTPPLSASSQSITGSNILHAILNAHTQENDNQNEEDEVEEITSEEAAQSSQPISSPPPHIWHIHVHEKNLYCIFVQRMKGASITIEAVGPQAFEIKMTAALTQNELQNLALTFSLSEDTIKKYFEAQKEIYHITTPVPIVTQGECVTNEPDFACVAFPVKQNNRLVL
jgi:hypothetical protein